MMRLGECRKIKPEVRNGRTAGGGHDKGSPETWRNKLKGGVNMNE